MKTLIKCAILLLTISVVWAQTIKVSELGFDEKNSTQVLQTALDSGAKTVIIDNVGKDWITEPLKIKASTTLVFEKGVRLKALKGSFKQKTDSLITVLNTEDVVIRGEEDVVLSMNKTDYMNQAEYAWGEWRHCISIVGSKNVKVSNLTVKSSGGDGIYVRGGSHKAYSENVVIEDIKSEDHLRQGISIISAKDLLIKNSSFSTTAGTAPQCGIDFEPNTEKDALINCVVEDCKFFDNKSSGILIHLSPLTAKTEPISLTFKNCVIYDNNSLGVSIYSSHTTPVKGSINFENCQIYNNKGGGILIQSQQKDGINISFKDIALDCSTISTPAILFNNSRIASNFYGVNFENVNLTVDKGNVFSFASQVGYGIKDVTGALNISKSGKKTVTQLSSIIKAYKPNEELQKLLQPSSYDLTSYKSLFKKLSAPPKVNSRTRGKFSFVQYIPDAGEYIINFKPVQITKAAANIQISVYDKNNTFIEKFAVKDNHDYVFKAHGENMLKFDIDTKYNGLLINSTTPGSGYLANNRMPFIYGSHDFYFYVPAGQKEINIEVNGTVSEPVWAKLISPTGKVVDSVENSEGSKILKYSRADNSKGKIWKLFIKGKEDFSIRIGSSTIPVLSTDPQGVITKRD